MSSEVGVGPSFLGSGWPCLLGVPVLAFLSWGEGWPSLKLKIENLKVLPDLKLDIFVFSILHLWNVHVFSNNFSFCSFSFLSFSCFVILVVMFFWVR